MSNTEDSLVGHRRMSFDDIPESIWVEIINKCKYWLCKNGVYEEDAKEIVNDALMYLISRHGKKIEVNHFSKDAILINEDGTQALFTTVLINKCGKIVLDRKMQPHGIKVSRSKKKNIKKNESKEYINVFSINEGEDEDGSSSNLKFELKSDNDPSELEYFGTIATIKEIVNGCVNYYYNQRLNAKYSYSIEFYPDYHPKDQARFSADYCIYSYRYQSLEGSMKPRDICVFLGVKNTTSGSLTTLAKNFANDVESCCLKKMSGVDEAQKAALSKYLIEKIEQMKTEVSSRG